MKLHSSTFRRWQRAAAMLRAGGATAIALALIAAAYLSFAAHRLREGADPAPSTRVPPNTSASPRPELVDEIGKRTLGYQLVAKPEEPASPATAPAVASPPPPPPPPPAVDVLATMVSASGGSAYVRRQDDKSVHIWIPGSAEAGYVVAEIGHGFIVLQGAGGEQRLILKKKGAS